MERKGIKNITVNEYVNVKNIRNEFIYTKDGYIIGFLKIPFVNIGLLSREALRARTSNMTAAWNGDKKDFTYISLPRELDLDNYKGFLKDKYTQEIENIGRRKILSLMILEGTKLSTSGENYEHLQYIKLWEPVGTNIKRAEEILKERLQDYRIRFSLAGSEPEILKKSDLVKLCNLFSNSNQASYENVEKNMMYTPITLINE